MRQKQLLNQIREYVENRNVGNIFKSSDFPFLEKSPSFISKHAVGNDRYKEYFIRVSRGKYKLK